MTSHCTLCGQPLPERPRDPPLPPLEQPAVVTIHDLPEGEVPDVEIVRRHDASGEVHFYRLRPAAAGGGGPPPMNPARISLMPDWMAW